MGYWSQKGYGSLEGYGSQGSVKGMTINRTIRLSFLQVCL